MGTRLIPQLGQPSNHTGRHSLAFLHTLLSQVEVVELTDLSKFLCECTFIIPEFSLAFMSYFLSLLFHFLLPLLAAKRKELFVIQIVRRMFVT